MLEITIKAYAKLNLSLDVCKKRDDGYHEVDMIMTQCSLFDVVRIRKDEALTLTTDCAELSDVENNLMMKAAKAFFDYTKVAGGACMSLEKHIPIAAGMAGGSTDAAAVLVGLNEIYETKLSCEELCKIGVKIGADVPYCIKGGIMRAQGIGEKLSYVGDTPDVHVVIVKGKQGLSTAEIYKKIDGEQDLVRPDNEFLIKCIKNGDIQLMAENMRNVMEQVSRKEIPEIESIKEKLTESGAMGALMSGSGPTVFGLFDDKNTALSAAEKFSEEYFVYCGTLK